MNPVSYYKPTLVQKVSTWVFAICSKCLGVHAGQAAPHPPFSWRRICFFPVLEGKRCHVRGDRYIPTSESWLLLPLPGKISSRMSVGPIPLLNTSLKCHLLRNVFPEAPYYMWYTSSQNTNCIPLAMLSAFFFFS